MLMAAVEWVEVDEDLCRILKVRFLSQDLELGSEDSEVTS